MMTIVHDAPGDPSTLGQQVAISVTMEVESADVAAADELVEGLVAYARNLDHEGPLLMESSYDATTARLLLRSTGGFGTLALLEGRLPDGQPLLDPELAVRVAANIEPLRYELGVAMNDHLLNASKNHPEGPVPLHVDTQYDDDRERMRVTIRGSLFACAYLMMLVHLQLTQSRFR